MCLVLAGCGSEVLYTDLTEADANEMLGLLLARDIKASKIPGKEGKYSVAVPREEFAASVDLLKWYGFPKEQFTGVGELFKKSGIVSSPSEEKIRYMYALGQDIAEMLSRIDGVITARVNLVLPQNDPYKDTTIPSSASVFLKFRPGMVPPDLVPQIKTLVMNSVEGLSYDKISVSLQQSTSLDFFSPAGRDKEFVTVLGLRVAPESARLVWIVIIGGGIFVLVGISAGAWAFRVHQGQTPAKKVV